jgi:hypothetical protein
LFLNQAAAAQSRRDSAPPGQRRNRLGGRIFLSLAQPDLGQQEHCFWFALFAFDLHRLHLICTVCIWFALFAFGLHCLLLICTVCSWFALFALGSAKKISEGSEV